MRFHTRKWVKPEDLNANGTLFGGKLLAWIDEEAALYSIIQLENKVRNKMTRETIITVENIIMVNLDEEGKPEPHGKTKVEFVKDRLRNKDS